MEGIVYHHDNKLFREGVSDVREKFDDWPVKLNKGGVKHNKINVVRELAAYRQNNYAKERVSNPRALRGCAKRPNRWADQ